MGRSEREISLELQYNGDQAALLPGPPQGVGLGVEDGLIQVQRLLGSKEKIQIFERLGQEVAGLGLTDLTEARLLTDADVADSDGLADGDDPLPGVPQSADSSMATQALAAVVEKIAGVGRRALIEGVAGTPAGVACWGQWIVSEISSWIT